MAENIVPFIFEGKEVRFVGTVDRPEWIAADVCACLEIKNVSQALFPLKPQDKGVCKVDTLGGVQEALTVYESGLYRLIFKSRKAEAERFQDWIFSKVLPEIRRTGSYNADKIDRIASENQKLKDARKALQSGVPNDSLTLGAIAKLHNIKVDQLVFALAENGRLDLIQNFARVSEYRRILRDSLKDVDTIVGEYKALNECQLDLFDGEVA